MTKTHVIRPGDCIASVAFENGLRTDTLWEHPDNAALRGQRESGFLLVPGDALVVPDPRPRRAACATGNRHVFKRHGVPEKLRIRLEDEGLPRMLVPYVLVIDGRTSSGHTDEEGRLEAWISPDAREGSLQVEDDPPMAIALGRLEPVSQDQGAHDRLRNLGLLDTGGIDEEGLDDAGRVTLALLRFQTLEELPPSGLLDDDTRAALAAAHGS